MLFYNFLLLLVPLCDGNFGNSRDSHEAGRCLMACKDLYTFIYQNKPLLTGNSKRRYPSQVAEFVGDEDRKQSARRGSRKP